MPRVVAPHHSNRGGSSRSELYGRGRYNRNADVAYRSFVWIVDNFSLPLAPASPFVVGGFGAARGCTESLALGENSALAADIATAFRGTRLQFSNTPTSPFFSSVDAVILGVGTSDTSAITSLSPSEQPALKSFILGIALMFSDNDTFAANAPDANANVLEPFGVTATGT